MGLCEWREHQGVPYLYTSYAITDPSHAGAIGDRQFELLMAEPAGSLVRLLVDTRGGLSGGWDREHLKRAREQGKQAVGHVRIRAAVLGVSGLLVPLIRGMSMIGGGMTLVPCPTEEKAFGYLMRD